MKILILHNQLWSQYKSIVFEKINNICLQNGDELLVLQTSICENSRKDLIDFDINNFSYGYTFKLLNNNYLEFTNPFLTTIKWITNICKFNPDIINLTGYSEPGTIFILLICKIFKIKTVMTNESVMNLNTSRNIYFYLFKKLYKKLIFRLTDYFFSYGINSNDFLFRHDVQKSKIVSFLNAFDSDRFKRINAKKFLDNDKYFLFVGRISKEKNIDFLLDLAKVFKNNSSAIKIKIIGNGPDFNYFKLKAISNHLTNIEFLGSIKWDFLGDYYVNSLGLILPSLFEPWGMVANEAFFYKIPVVCSNFCGCAGDLVIDQFNGIVIDDLSVLDFESSANDFLGNFLSLKNNFTDNIEKTNNIFEPERLSFEHYRSFKNIVC